MDTSKILLDSLCSAPLLVGDLPEAISFDRRLLEGADAEACLNFQQKLGHLYEDALGYLLETSASLDMLAKSLQVHGENKQTIGELDFLVRNCASGEVLALELAIKFYLATPVSLFEREVESQNGVAFPGPDARDNWFRKLAKMRSHQLQLSQREETTVLLQERFGIEQPVATQQLIYGCIFQPMLDEHREKTSSQPVPDEVLPSSRTGYWIFCRDWSKQFTPEQLLVEIPKVLWPAELTQDDLSQLPTKTFEQLEPAAQERCTMVYVSDAERPIFLVPDAWPNHR